MSSAVVLFRGNSLGGELAPLAWLTLPLIIMAWTLDSARWVDQLPTLTIQVVVGVLASYFIVRRFERSCPTHLVGVAVSATGSTVVASASLAGSHLFGVGLFLLAVTWVTAYATVWIAYRRRTSVALLLPGLLVITIALAFLPPPLYSRLLLFILAGAPAIGLFRYRVKLGNAADAAPAGPAFVATMIIALIVITIWASATSVASFRFGPLDDARESLADNWTSFTRDLFGNVPNRRVIPSIRLTDSLPFAGPLELNQDAMLLVTANKPRKWRLATYETYTSEGWTKSSIQTTLGGPQQKGVSQAPTLSNRTEIKMTVRTQGIMDEIATAGIPVGTTIDSVMHLSKGPRFDIALNGEQSQYLPPSVAAVRSALMGAGGENVESTIAGAGFLQALESDTRLVLQRVEDDVAPRLGLEFAQHLVPPRTYESVGDVSIASSEQLRAAGRDYPLPISDRYLQLPIDFPERVRALALELAQGRENPYDIAVSVQAFLKRIPYSTTIESPPAGVDAVGWFIFENHVGFCNYYASAMITMLRSLKIPARLAVGFAPGDFDRDRGMWVVQARHYHAWPEVYFPHLGWIEFEPTNSGVQRSLALLDSPPAGRLSGIVTPLDVVPDCPSGVEECDEIAQEDDIFDAGAVPDAAGPRGGMGRWAVLGVSIAGLVLLFGGCAYVWRSGSQTLKSPASRSFLLLRWLGRVSGDGRWAAETPVEFSDRLAARLPRYRDSFREIAFAYTYSRYGGGDPPSSEDARCLRNAVSAVRRAAFLVPFTQLSRLWSWRLIDRSLPRSSTSRSS